MIVIILVISSCLLSSCETLQYFSEEPKYQEVNPGDGVALSCIVADKHRSSECIWQRDRKAIRVPQQGKYEWAGARDSGDCSLRVLQANIDYDDGSWECQVTVSSFEAGDALNSAPARLVVRQPPTKPRIYRDGEFLSTGEKLSMKAGEEVKVRCESTGGNPPAKLEWFIDDTEIPATDEKNETDIGNEKQWTARSVLVFTFTREHDEKSIRCSAHHEAFSRKFREESLALDILYPPEVRLQRTPDSLEVEDGVDDVVVSCKADGNPRPDVIWRKLGGDSIFRLGAKLEFTPVRRKDSGTYICLAQNDVGASDEISVPIDVRYPPTGIRTDPRRFVDLEVGDKTSFSCSASGNPEPTFEWLQKVNDKKSEDTVYSRGLGSRMAIGNVTYEHEGLWVCAATNSIKGRERKVQSEVMEVGVSGRPLLTVPYPAQKIHAVGLGDKAEVKVQFCSDPEPMKLRWEWGSLQLGVGEDHGRFKVLDLQETDIKDCYTSQLNIEEAATGDDRFYYMITENGAGMLRAGVRLVVQDPISMVTFIAIAVAGLFLLIILLLFLVYSHKARRCCFRDKGHFEPNLDIRIEPREDAQDSDISRFSEEPGSSSQEPTKYTTSHAQAFAGHPTGHLRLGLVWQPGPSLLNIKYWMNQKYECALHNASLSALN